jgi:hypothetical protein
MPTQQLCAHLGGSTFSQPRRRQCLLVCAAAARSRVDIPSNAMWGSSRRVPITGSSSPTSSDNPKRPGHKCGSATGVGGSLAATVCKPIDGVSDPSYIEHRRRSKSILMSLLAVGAGPCHGLQRTAPATNGRFRRWPALPDSDFPWWLPVGGKIANRQPHCLRDARCPPQSPAAQYVGRRACERQWSWR